MSMLARTRRPAVGRETFDGFDAVRLAAGDLQAVFVPGLGMAGVSLLHAGEELLDRREGLEAYRATGAVMGLPLLHPWANRLSGDDYAVDGRRVVLSDVTREEHGLPIHGVVSTGWQVTAARAGERSARLHTRLDAGADPRLLAAFPFPHEIRFDVALTAGALTIRTTVRAAGDAAVPVALGFHPYLRLPGTPRERWLVAMPRRRHVELDARGLPTGRARPRPPSVFALADRALDDAYEGIDDGAGFAVAAAGRRIEVVHHTGFPVAQAFSPPGAPFLCLEPMTAPVDALRSGAGLGRATPGTPRAAEFSIRVWRDA